MSKRVVLFAAALSLVGSAAGPVMAMPRASLPNGGMPAITQIEPAGQNISARKRAWFRHAITRILAGDVGRR